MKIALSILLMATVVISGFSQKDQEDLSINYFKTGVDKFNAKEYGIAIQYMDSALIYDPNNAYAYRIRGGAETILHKYSEALLDFDKAISINSMDSIAYEGKANVLRYTGKFEEAEKAYTEALNRFPNGNMYFGRGLCYYSLKNYELAIIDLTKSIERSKKGTAAYFYRAVTYVFSEQYNEALNDFDKYLQLGGERTSPFYYHRGIAYFNTNQIDNAISDFNQTLRKVTDDANVYQYIARCYVQKGDSINARINFQKATQLSPENAINYGYWGNAESDFKNYVQAEKLLKKAIELGKSKKYIASMYYLRALSKAAILDTSSAFNFLTKAIELDSTVANYYFDRAMLMRDYQDHYAQVISDIHKTIQYTNLNKVDKEKVAIYYIFAALKELNHRDYDIAIEDLTKAIALTPNEGDIYLMRAFASYAKYQEDEEKSSLNSTILSDIDKALSLNNKYWQAHVLKAQIFMLDSKDKSACKELKTAEEFGASVNKKITNFLCKGKDPKELRLFDVLIEIPPRLLQEYIKISLTAAIPFPG